MLDVKKNIASPMGTVVSLRKYSEYGTLVDTDENAFATESGASPSESAIDHDALGNVHQDVNTDASPTFITLITTGGRRYGTTRITVADSPYTLLSTDHYLYCDTDEGAIEVILPEGTDGTMYNIKNVGSSGYDVTITPYGDEEVEAEDEAILEDAWSYTLQFETTENWRVA